jgi:hypothetical protein
MMHSEWSVKHEEGINTQDKRCIGLHGASEFAEGLGFVLLWNFFAGYLRREDPFELLASDGRVKGHGRIFQANGRHLSWKNCRISQGEFVRARFEHTGSWIGWAGNRRLPEGSNAHCRTNSRVRLMAGKLLKDRKKLAVLVV